MLRRRGRGFAIVIAIMLVCTFIPGGATAGQVPIDSTTDGGVLISSPDGILTTPSGDTPEQTDTAIEPSDLGAAGSEGPGQTLPAIDDDFVWEQPEEPGDTSALATPAKYLNIPRFSDNDVFSVAEKAAIASGNYSIEDFGDANVLTIKDGILLSQSQGVAIMDITLAGGDVSRYYVTVYYPYPQPKTGTVRAGHDPVTSRWGKLDYTDSAGVHLEPGVGLTIKWRSTDHTSPDSDYYPQYVTDGHGHEGYVSATDNNDWPIMLMSEDGNSNAYFLDVRAGSSNIYIDTADSNGFIESNSWSSANTAIATVTPVTHSGYGNVGLVHVVKEGSTCVTATHSTGVKTSSFISVYTSISNIAGRINKDTHTYMGADSRYPAGRESTGAAVIISGECGDFWRVGQNRFILKKDVSIPATGISIRPNPLFVATKGDSKREQLEAILLPAIGGVSVATDKVSWTSDGESIAVVDQSGLVTGVGEGKTQIRATAGALGAICQVTVENVPISKITLDKTTLSMKPGAAAKVTAKVEPKHAYDKVLTWESRDKSIATVDQNGNVKAVKAGKTAITAKAKVGGAKADCVVTVVSEAIAQPAAAGTENEDLGIQLYSISGVGKKANKHKVTFKTIYFYLTADMLGSPYASTYTPYIPAQYYVLRRQKNGAGSYAVIGSYSFKSADKDPGSITMTDQSASPGVSYKYRVDAYYKIDKPILVSSQTFVTNKGAAVKGLDANALTPSSVKLTWKKDSGAAGYVVYASANKSNKTYSLKENLAGSGKVSYVVKGLKSNTKYYFYVMAYKKRLWASNQNNTEITQGKPAKASDTTSRQQLGLYFSKLVGKGSVTVNFKRLSNAKYFLFQKYSKKKKAYVNVTAKTVTSGSRYEFTDKKFDGSSTSYRIIAYKDSSKKARVSQETTTIGSGKSSKWYKVQADKGDPFITLFLKKKTGYTGYRLYRSADNKTYQYISTVYLTRGKDGKVKEKYVTYVDTSKALKYNTKYYYKAIPFKDVTSKDSLYRATENTSPSAAKSVKTPPNPTEQNTIDFFNARYYHALNPPDGNAAVRYELVDGKTLQIHVYLEFLGNATEMNTQITVDGVSGTVSKTAAFRQGIINMWSGRTVSSFASAGNDAYDFPTTKDIKFTTQVVIHMKEDETNTAQKFIQVHFGDESCKDKHGKYWYFSLITFLNGAQDWDYNQDSISIHMPSDKDVESTGRNPKKDNRYASTAGHEFGHVLGLADAYKEPETETSRLDPSSETTVSHKNDFGDTYHDNIMSYSAGVQNALPNDIEMILNAYNLSAQNSNVSYQAYRNFTDNNGRRFMRSGVIILLSNPDWATLHH